MILDDYFMVIPVYRVTEDNYFLKMKEDFDNHISSSYDESIRQGDPNLVQKLERTHQSSYGGVWEFNEIIGYIKLFFMGNQVRGEYWSTKPRAKVKTRKKEFEFKAHKLVPEAEISQKTNAGILSAVENYLDRCKKELKSRHIDLREFNTLKGHIDWLAIHETKNLTG